MNTTNYYSMGIDAHKQFCQVHVLHPDGSNVWKGRIKNDEYHRYAEIVKELDGPCRATFESSTNWHILYDTLTQVKGISQVTMAHPLKVKLICAAQLKNDKVDALKLAQLLRLEMIPPAHATGPEARYIKELVRQRSAWVGMRTRIRNRTHRLLGACPDEAELPKSSDLFGTKSLAAMRKLQLPEPYQFHLHQNLAALEELKTMVVEIEKQLVALSQTNPNIRLLLSIPGLGKVLSSVIAAEVDDIARFPHKKQFIGYCGLAPTTRGSAGNFYQGHMIQACNKWLKWAFIEAAWVAIGCDDYFRDYYQRLQKRGKKPNTAVSNIARRMAQIAWEILYQKRPYESRLSTFPVRSSQGLMGDAA
jgi:transposase